MTDQVLGLDADSLRPALARVLVGSQAIETQAAIRTHFPVSLVPDPVRPGKLSVDCAWPARWDDVAGSEAPDSLLGRIPLAYAWELLLRGRNSALALSRAAAARTMPTDAVGEAFRACSAQGKSDRPKLAAHVIPNSLDEDERELLLRALRFDSAAERVELLWRPIAAVLEWLERFGPDESGQWQANIPIGRVLHLHLGLESFEATDMAIVPYPHRDKLILLPGRRSPLAGEHLLGLPLALAESVCHRVAATNGQAHQRRFPWELLWKSPFLLAGTGKSGPMPPAPPWFAGAPINSALAQFQRLIQTDSAAPTTRLISALDRPTHGIRQWLERIQKPDGDLLGAVVTGPLANPTSLVGTALAPMLRRLVPSTLKSVLIEGRDSQFILAQGACRYATRKLAGLPAYLDTLPVVSTIVRDEIGEPKWTNLLETETPWVLGGEILRFTPEKTRFQVARGESNITLTVHREGVETCRQVASDIGHQLVDECPVHLFVQVEPAQGRPRVEVVPHDATLFLGQSLVLDWDTATDTGRTRDQELKAVERCYPPHEPRLASSNRWRERLFYGVHAGTIGVRGLVANYCSNPKSWQHEATHSLQYLNQCLKETRLSADSRISSCVSSDHLLYDKPSADDLTLLTRFVGDVDDRLRSRDKAELRDCLRILGSVSARTPRLLTVLRAFLQRRLAPENNHMENALLWACGNCLWEKEDIQLFFRHVDRESMTSDRAQALGRILMYRPMALEGATSAQCEAWLRKCQQLVTGPLRGKNLELSRGALAIAYVLRRRFFDTRFLLPESALARDIKTRVRTVIASKASAVTAGVQRILDALHMILRYIDCKGRGRITALAMDDELEDEPGP